MKDALKVFLVLVPNPEASPPAVNIIGAGIWMLGTLIFWWTHGWFDSVIGKLCFFPAFFLAGGIGYCTTFFLLCATTVIAVLGWLIGWIFGFPFFGTIVGWYHTVCSWFN